MSPPHLIKCGTAAMAVGPQDCIGSTGRQGAWDHTPFAPLLSHGCLRGHKLVCAAATEATTPTTAPQKEAKWDENYLQLAAYHARHGHCNVPRRYRAAPALGKWVDNQRRSLKDDRLMLDRVARLGALGFQVDPRTDQWNEHCRKLEDHRD